jgi:hypothetical protein
MDPKMAKGVVTGHSFLALDRASSLFVAASAPPCPPPRETNVCGEDRFALVAKDDDDDVRKGAVVAATIRW